MKKKIGIVTFNDAFNYGAFLQEYALQKYLRINDFQAEVINYQNNKFGQLYRFANNPIRRKGLKNKLKIVYNMVFRPNTYVARLNKNKKFIKCCEQEIVFSERFESYNNQIESYYDYFIAGSDQVWNVRMTNYNFFYLLDFIKDPRKKLSYAASFGRVEFDDNDYEVFKQYIGQFSSVLVREKSGCELLDKKCGISSEVVLDPTFLLKAADWERFAEKSIVDLTTKKFILLYVVSLPTNMYRAAIQYADQRNLDIVLLGRNSDIVIDGKRLKASVDVGPYEFINYLINAEAIFTTSFHGTILSINLRKPFFFELSREKINNNSRLVDIIEMFSLQQREIVSDSVTDEQIPWADVQAKLDEILIQSEKLLLNSINCDL